jgi:hypothetical protein
VRSAQTNVTPGCSAAEWLRSWGGDEEHASQQKRHMICRASQPSGMLLSVVKSMHCGVACRTAAVKGVSLASHVPAAHPNAPQHCGDAMHPLAAGGERPSFVAYFKSLADYKEAAGALAAAVEQLKQQQQGGHPAFLTGEQEARLAQCLAMFGAHVQQDDVADKLLEGGTSCCQLPLAEATKLLHGRQLGSSGGAANLSDHVAALKSTAYEASCWDAASAHGNAFHAMVRRTEMALPHTSGLLAGTTLRDLRGGAQLGEEDGQEGVVIVVQACKEGANRSLHSLLRDSGVLTAWLEAFRHLQAAGWAGLGDEVDRRPFTMPVVMVVVLAERAYERDCTLARKKVMEASASLAGHDTAEAVREAAERVRSAAAKLVERCSKHTDTVLRPALISMVRGADTSSEHKLGHREVGCLLDRQLRVHFSFDDLYRELLAEVKPELQAALEPLAATAAELRGMADRIREARDAADEVRRQGALCSSVGAAAGADTHLRAMLAPVCSTTPRTDQEAAESAVHRCACGERAGEHASLRVLRVGSGCRGAWSQAVWWAAPEALRPHGWAQPVAAAPCTAAPRIWAAPPPRSMLTSGSQRPRLNVQLGGIGLWVWVWVCVWVWVWVPACRVVCALPRVEHNCAPRDGMIRPGHVGQACGAAAHGPAHSWAPGCLLRCALLSQVARQVQRPSR